MSTELFMKGWSVLILSGVLAWAVYDRSDGGLDGDRQRYLPCISGQLLPACIAALVVCELVFYGRREALRITVSFCFGVFLHICLYYLLLMPALPFLRRHISARSCAVLWMLPNYLYITQMSYMSLPAPRWVVEVPTALVRTLLGVWLAGFLAVLGWKIASHLIFRARILRRAVPVTDPAALEVWRREVEDARFKKPKFKLVISPDVRTPLSVGLFARSVRVVLPERDYTPEELALVFHHELVHIGREDAWSKFFLVFCTAVCWFNPLMWIAMRKSAEDLELSCDETVLLGAGEDAKRRYASLLLKTAGDERGFTTCLSASAGALRYRLKSVVEPGKKRSGALAVGLVFFLLCMSCGYVALAYGEDTGAELIYQSRETEQYALRDVRWDGDPFYTVLVCPDEAGLHRALSSLRMEQIAGNYSFQTEDKTLCLLLNAPEGTLGVTLSSFSGGDFIRVSPLYGKESAQTYYLPDGLDREALGEYILEMPAMSARVTGSGSESGHSLTATLWRAERLEGDRVETVYRQDERETPGGIYGHQTYRQAELSFNFPLLGDCTAEIVPLSGGEGRTMTLDRQSPTLPLSEESARYIVRGEFLSGDGARYRAEFRFEIGDIEDVMEPPPEENR